MATYNKKPQRPVVAQPVGLTQSTMDTIVTAFTSHFSKVVSPDILIANRKAVYALVINGTDTSGNSLEQLVGSENAKAMTEVILNSMSSKLGQVDLTVTQAQSYQQ